MTSDVRYDFSLSGKVAVVTGGASGIGEAIVDAYAAKGAIVVILDKAIDAGQRKVSQGSAVAAFGCDVTSELSVADAVSAVTEEFNRIDVLVNSAGIGIVGAAEDLTVGISRWPSTCEGPFSSVNRRVESCSLRAAAQ
jgi:D-threitol dehydrogenase (NAD+)